MQLFPDVNSHKKAFYRHNFFSNFPILFLNLFIASCMFKFELSPEQVSASMYEINQIKTFLRPLVNGENKSIDGFSEKI